MQRGDGSDFRAADGSLGCLQDHRSGGIVAYVITDQCIKDELCIQACPVDCIRPRNDEAAFEGATQMYVDPGECIDCGACVPACTSDAIFALDEVPADKCHFIEINEAHFAAG
jgi:NAD-dependent dihydropyrimidine dehydrogenase PreA subunit